MFGYDTIGSATIGGVADTAPPSGAITSQPAPDGQDQRFAGTATNAYSGSYTLTSGAGTIGPIDFAIAGGLFDFTVAGLPAGSYTPVLTITGAGGSVIVTGTSAFTIIGVSGGGEIEVPDTVTSVIVYPATATVLGGVPFTFTKAVIGTGDPDPSGTWTTNLGAINAAGELTVAGLPLEQNGAVTFTSALNPAKSDSATFTVPVYIAPVEPVDARYARPITDVVAGPWLASTGSNLADMLNEDEASIFDFITATGPGAAEMKLWPVQDPETNKNQVVRYEAHAPDGGATLTVRLKQGADTVIAEWFHDTLPAIPTIHERGLSAIQCDSITDYTDLRVELVAA